MLNTAAHLRAALLVACVLVSVQGYSQEAPTPIARNGVTYVTGGIGEDEVRAFHEVARQYNMRLTFASKTGHYLSDVDVSITSNQHVILSARSEGPFLFVHVPPGRYRIAARDRHLTETKEVVVPSTGAIDVRFYWDDPDRHGVMQLCQRCPKPAQQ